MKHAFILLGCLLSFAMLQAELKESIPNIYFGGCGCGGGGGGGSNEIPPDNNG